MVDVQTRAEVEDVVRGRLAKALPQIRRSLAAAASGDPGAAEPSRTRAIERIEVKANVSRSVATELRDAMVADDAPVVETAAPVPRMLPEAVRGSVDFVGVSFLGIGRLAANAVGRVAFLGGQPQGTGFLVAPGLLLTNSHVIDSPEAARQLCVQFDYELDANGMPLTPSVFLFAPEACFVSDGIQGLDFTLIAVGAQRAGPRALEAFGFLALSDAGNKHMLGDIANVVQHPDGRFKELVLRENRLVSRDETAQVLHYVADTEQGSSGSPVFNNQWQPIALHHWGGPWLEVTGTAGQPLASEINEGIRISAIVQHLRRLSDEGRLPQPAEQALALWSEREATAPLVPVVLPASEHTGDTTMAPVVKLPATQTLSDGRTLTWTIPLEVSVRLGGAPAVPQAVAEGGAKANDDFADRGGYEPGFIPGFIVPLPDYSRVKWTPARNRAAQDQDDPHELRYHHFSIVMNKDRRLCGFTAVNIDGRRIKAIDRATKTVTDHPTLKDLGIESLGGAEASDAFRPDSRVDIEEQMTRPFYEQQVVPGFPDTSSHARIARMFQKGHIVLRSDPAWGTDAQALAAEHDTFFYTNAAPQVGFFNQGSALNRPGSKGKLRWRAVETYMLRNAVTMKARVSVFAGPVFAATDPDYRFGSKVPLRFWKIAVWNERGKLRSVALLADQSSVLKVMPEAFADQRELARVAEFVTTVKEIERLTGLNFGTAVRDADMRRGQGRATVPVASFDPGRRGAPRKRAKAARTGAAAKNVKRK